MSSSIWIVWFAGAGLAAVGAALLTLAITGWRDRRSARATVGRCACCGYSTSGLEGDICPECGLDVIVSNTQRAARTRTFRALLGGASLLVGTLAWPLGEAMRGGVAHALPNVALIEVVRFVPSERIGAWSELQVRVQAGLVEPWGRRELASVCASVLGGTPGPQERRQAAMLAACVARECEDATIRRMLADKDVAVRACGVQALNRSERCAAWGRTALMSMASSDRSALVRKRAVDAMREVGGCDTLSTLVAALEDPNEGVRQRATYALGFRAPDPASALALATVCTLDVDESVRAAARWALLRLGGAA